MEQTFADIVKKLESGSPQWSDMLALLDTAKANNHRESRVVAHYGSELIEKYASKLGGQKWDVLEQVAMAAMDAGDLTKAQKYVTQLIDKFGKNTTRVLRLSALLLEATEKYEEATHIYDSILHKDPTDTVAMKRKIAIAKKTQPSSHVIELLNKYLTVFMADAEAWGELADIYLGLQSYSNACFCFEELILAFPQNYHYYVKYAEIKYTMGGASNLVEALKYYSLSLELSKENNLRAYYGLILTVHALKSVKSYEVSTEAQELATWAASEIKSFYKQSKKLPVVLESLKELGQQ